MEVESPRPDAKLLYRRLDALFGRLDPSRPPTLALGDFLGDLFQTLREDLRLAGGLLYAEGRDGFDLAAQVGDLAGTPADPLGHDLACIALVSRFRTYLYPDSSHPSTPAAAGILPPGPAAAIVVQEPPGRYVFFFLLRDGWVWEEIEFALNTIRSALGARLMEERVRGSFVEAAAIQKSLLVDEAPDFSDFDIACRSQPADEVGGDFYDFIAFDSEILGLAIGDASGHGLPAALLVRDVVTGLRMGLEKDMKVGYAFSKLNRVIHRSRLSSRFISVFYGELENNGNLIYVNAGHEPPMLLDGDTILELRTGGTVIGPLPEVRFKRGIAQLPPGGMLLLFTDGIVERSAPDGEHFGKDRLRALLRAYRDASAEGCLDGIFRTVAEWGADRAWEDDATIVVVKRGAGA